ncbi:50S ribosomal protein L24 [Metamycoplasma hyosynoviae]|uniref:Large ribosomal subunit protein uL24 n=1 Tax=Metamycoplasma hyosynoviae TaxID=29559 RepID=A0A063Y8G4_9BACT|nr:50S ribosomal protein L24 [Metamycoplasma hyosynoviae]KDE41932.1 50S ribosomal protein L24 [Metamycoplasma hyosynoviae]KDE41979.1 50S ribosomal protein L24 [Metamycoplasma hyosynoviae]KDE43340.1 50S ribosomal protein L24 [Metamycoplasma hyosynoviae]KDE43817.1 50S ribosomal protein L24 [Metamycoplasma hyosynoviae]KDE45149.1 50S ribosomal protein L24 [Metamycoplasma hyosynoviae]
MALQKIKKNDLVVILSGEHKGKVGAVLEVNSKNQTVVVKDINKKTKHHKPSQENQEGKIEVREYPIHISKVAYMIKKGNAQNKGAVSSKIGWKLNEKTGKKERFLKKTKKVVAGDK